MIGEFDRTAAAEAIEAPGTPEEQWAAWAELARLPAVRPPSGPVVVVAAHPDDEVLGFGGTMAQLSGEVRLVTVTDGEGSHPHLAAERIAALRAAELERALGELGLREHRTYRLRIPDTGVDAHEARLERELAAVLRETGAALCVAPWTGDLHADHEAAGRAAAAAARETGTPCWHYPVWMWHWASPGDPRVPWSAARRLPLSRPARTRKEAAIRRFASQLAPLGPGDDTVILPPAELAHHTRPFEVVFT
ncbi:PIG-L family deacetylase [Streptomyces sp. WAC 06725]|uniref:PIG-L deacetylase family protein n=1 Tax=Streptomyces sp. WAC 06725 TaxID=2203209 RepID=UPI000F7420E5|nr:PIG-L family deacetylase [Streptomyces sp. WAC 06725]RSO20343.1 PIG-L family deacetylase [Streptomyces sp. WAC 06725]